MQACKVIAASEMLLGLWQQGSHTDGLPEELRPLTAADAYAIQALLERKSAFPLAGWKIAATSLAGQAHIGVHGPMAGRLLEERIVPEHVPVKLGKNRMLVAEVEFVFRMGTTLMPRQEPYTQDEVATCVAALHLGIEVPDSRFVAFEKAGEAQLIADNACADQFVLGPEVDAVWREVDLATHQVQGRSSRGFVHHGCGANVLGGPMIALTWLANELRRYDIPLSEGHIVTTGTCCVPMPVGPGDVVTGDYGALGTLEVTFAD